MNPTMPNTPNTSNDTIPLIPTPNQSQTPPSRWQLIYDMAMLVLIVIDLFLMGLDSLLTSTFMASIGRWLGFADLLMAYQQHIHGPLKTLGGFFTIFLVAELVVRWGLAIYQKRHYRWFFFPFVHWYEVLGCLPQLRALRLLRAGVIGYRLHQMGYKVVPKSWLKTAKFYYHVVLEEISDRVILTAIENIRSELQFTNGRLVQNIIDKHRLEIQTVIVELLEQEVTPLLSTPTNQPPKFAEPLAKQVGEAIQQALVNTPELRRIMRMIPIAGGLIESQMLGLGQHIGENLTLSLSKNLTQPDTLKTVYQEIAEQLSKVDTTSPALEKLVGSIIEESLTALTEQVKIQQWKHQATGIKL
ncbi:MULTISPECIES: hypothetical protein [unclassified Moraxella]|uniref:hypothetical protein n=1 Tax=unclassified Moraxella TaxID=2685852 RepID=UPI003AF8236E